MKMTIDLNDAKVHIPHGRMMNLKQNLKWGEIKIEKDKILTNKDNILKEMEKSFYEHFDKCTPKMKSSALDRNTLLSKLTTSYVDEKMTTTTLNIESMREQVQINMQSLGENVMNNPQVQEKLAKLKKLKLINNG